VAVIETEVVAEIIEAAAEAVAVIETEAITEVIVAETGEETPA